MNLGSKVIERRSDSYMPTYHTYDPAKDELKPGTRIRLAGREGGLTNFLCENEVIWDDAPNFPASYPDLARFPLLEVADAPLTISKRLKEEIKNKLEETYPPNVGNMLAWLDSLEVTD